MNDSVDHPVNRGAKLILSAEVELGPLGAALVWEHCLRQKMGTGLLPRAALLAKFPPKTDNALYRVPSRCWRLFYGGISVAVVLPSGVADRVVGVFKDAEAARAIWDAIQKFHKTTLLLQRTPDGRWWAYIRYRRYTGSARVRESKKTALGLFNHDVEGRLPTRGYPWNKRPPRRPRGKAQAD